MSKIHVLALLLTAFVSEANAAESCPQGSYVTTNGIAIVLPLAASFAPRAFFPTRRNYWNAVLARRTPTKTSPAPPTVSPAL